VEIPLTSVVETVVFTEGVREPTTSEEIVVGKTVRDTGVKMSVVKFDLEELKRLQEENGIWIYESYITLTVKDTSTSVGEWTEQVTKMQPLAVPLDEVTTNNGQLTSEQNLDEPTGQFNEISRQPLSDRPMSAEFTETIQKFISPYNKDKNEDYNGVALVNYYTDDTNENYGNQIVKYYSFDNETDVELVPMIDVCYKEVPVKECEHPYEPETSTVVTTVVLVKDEESQTNTTLTHGTDDSGNTYRTIIKFDLGRYSENFRTYDIADSFIHLNYLKPSDENNPANRTVNVHKITEDWNEDDVTFENVRYEEKPAGSFIIEEERLGGTEVTISITELVEEWIERGVVDNFGVILIDADEEESSSVPQYAHESPSEPNQYQPQLTICRKTMSSTSAPVVTSTQRPTEMVATQTTPFIAVENACKSRTVEPVEPIKVYVVNETTVVDPDDYDDEDLTLCISTSPIEITYCEDVTGRCKKVQRREIFGKLSTNCNCCLPKTKVEVHTFDCHGNLRDLEIKQIGGCFCQQCGVDYEADTTNMEIVEPNEVIDKRAAESLQLVL